MEIRSDFIPILNHMKTAIIGLFWQMWMVITCSCLSVISCFNMQVVGLHFTSPTALTLLENYSEACWSLPLRIIVTVVIFVVTVIVLFYILSFNIFSPSFKRRNIVGFYNSAKRGSILVPWRFHWNYWRVYSCPFFVF